VRAERSSGGEVLLAGEDRNLNMQYFLAYILLILRNIKYYTESYHVPVSINIIYFCVEYVIFAGESIKSLHFYAVVVFPFYICRSPGEFLFKFFFIRFI
jgi:hypothetical protein